MSGEIAPLPEGRVVWSLGTRFKDRESARWAAFMLIEVDGWTAAAVAQRTGYSARTIRRWRSEWSGNEASTSRT